ncbi:DUF4258 domain-containing protein [Kitasatospora sp. MAP5-34]|uniref:DUF4258 domain-containing protein n=1 Tax=Kitasatospora sp. MAP5-34 TaxID=3035102 RepID=UPI0024737613|nr:DUF4258 domain-containing protein [Kitasatospora sp. MAP5-34]MDH6577637.1 hypothetical protein [Kitasatospora sp. MAP5-34]
MIIRKSARLVLLAVTASALALGATPAMAATPTATPAAVANAFGPPIHCDFDCPITPAEICAAGVPTSIDYYSQHARDRMAERNISVDEVQRALGGSNHSCDRRGIWTISRGMDGGLLTLVVATNGDWSTTLVTAYWDGQPA